MKPARSEAEVREGSGGSRGEKSRVDGTSALPIHLCRTAAVDDIVS